MRLSPAPGEVPWMEGVERQGCEQGERRQRCPSINPETSGPKSNDFLAA